jgi:hypothetical protein
MRRREPALLAVSLAVAGCAVVAAAPSPDVREDAAIAGPATTCDHVPSGWVDRDVGRDRIRYSDAVQADGGRAESGLIATRVALSELLAIPSAATTPVTLWLTTSSDTIGTGVALTRSDARRATMFIYSPSCDPDPRPRRFEKTLLQELSGDYLQATTRMRPGGWRFYEAPPWFVQGMEEWVTLQLHDRPTDLVSAAIAVAKASPDDAILLREGRIAVANPYRDGLALVAWLAATRAVDAPTRILTSDAPTFDAALSEVVGLDGAGLVAAYRQWRAGTGDLTNAHSARDAPPATGGPRPTSADATNGYIRRRTLPHAAAGPRRRAGG